MSEEDFKVDEDQDWAKYGDEWNRKKGKGPKLTEGQAEYQEMRRKAAIASSAGRRTKTVTTDMVIKEPQLPILQANFDFLANLFAPRRMLRPVARPARTIALARLAMGAPYRSMTRCGAHIHVPRAP